MPTRTRRSDEFQTHSRSRTLWTTLLEAAFISGNYPLKSQMCQKAQDGRGDILYPWHASRAATCLESLLHTPRKTFFGILQCDGYKAYETYRNQREDIELIGCWAHVRRKFFEAKDQKPKLTGWFLNQIEHSL